MPVVWSDRHRLHEPGGEIWVGVRTPGTEVPERAERIRAALEGARFVEARPQPPEALLAVHDGELVDFLARAWSDWEAAGLTEDPGPGPRRALPVPPPRPVLGLRARARGGHDRPRGPVRLRHDDADRAGHLGGRARRGRLRADRRRPRGRGRAGRLRLLPPAGPPRHARRLRRLVLPQQRRRRGGAAAAARPRGGDRRRRAPRQRDAVDLLRGRGGRSSARCTSIPGAGWFPHFLGFADETGGGANRNLPLAPGLRRRAVARGGVRAGRLGASRRRRGAGRRARGGRGRRRPGEPAPGHRRRATAPRAGRSASCGLPTVVVQEGGYDLATIGPLVREALTGLELGR